MLKEKKDPEPELKEIISDPDPRGQNVTDLSDPEHWAPPQPMVNSVNSRGVPI